MALTSSPRPDGYVHIMDFELSEDQVAFRSTLRKFVDNEIRPVANHLEHAGEYPTDIVEKMKTMGLFGMTVPASYGGLELDAVSMTIVFEEISRGWMGISGFLGTHSLATWMIAQFGTEQQKRSLLPDLATGTRRTGIALTEPDGGTDLQAMRTRAIRDGDEFVLNGSKTWITNARFADPLPVLCKTDPDVSPAHAGMSVLLVDKATTGFEVSRDLGKIGYKGPESCEVTFTDCRVPAANVLGGPVGHGWHQVMTALGMGRLNVAARAVGVAQEAYDQALSYANQREAFGRTIGQFQTIQAKLAEMAIAVQASRLMTWWAASQFDAAARSDAGDRSDVEAGMAKHLASETALMATLESMRIHGAAGYSTELDIERLYRDAPLMAIGEGTNEVLRLVVAKGLLAGRTVIG